MPIQPITFERYARKRWKRPTDFSFASDRGVAPLGAEEVHRAVMLLPVGFARSSDAVSALGILGVEGRRNDLVSSDGRWIGHYVPALFRCYPFAVGRIADGSEILCINEDSGLVTDDPTAESFYDADGKPSKALAEAANLTQALSASLKKTAALAASMDKLGLLKPWASLPPTLTGLLCVDEVRLNALSPEDLTGLRDSGALVLAYCQLLSMQHMPMIEALAAARRQTAATIAQLPVNETGDLDLEFLNAPSRPFKG